MRLRAGSPRGDTGMALRALATAVLGAHDPDFARHVDYIHYNPVKHELDWPHSSFHTYVRQGLLPEDWAGDAKEIGSSYGERANT